MKIINNYTELGALNTDAKKIIYNKMHDKMHQTDILNLSTIMLKKLKKYYIQIQRI